MKKFLEFMEQDIKDENLTLVDAVVYCGTAFVVMVTVMLLAGVIERLTA